MRFWFADWRVSGSRVKSHEGRRFGPIFFAQHMLSQSVMKMTAQIPPLGPRDTPSMHLQTQSPGSDHWTTVAEKYIHSLARTATFRIPDWILPATFLMVLRMR